MMSLFRRNMYLLVMQYNRVVVGLRTTAISQGEKQRSFTRSTRKKSTRSTHREPGEGETKEEPNWNRVTRDGNRTPLCYYYCCHCCLTADTAKKKELHDAPHPRKFESVENVLGAGCNSLRVEKVENRTHHVQNVAAV